MSEQPERSRYIYDDQDELEVFDLDELEIKPEPKKPIAASAILEFKLETDTKE